MRLAEPFADFQFLADRQRTLLTHYLQGDDTSRSTTLHRHKVEDASEINARLPANQFREFVCRIVNIPAVEIHRLLVVVVQHL